MTDWMRILLPVLSVTTIIATAAVGLLFGSIKTLRDTAIDLRARVGDLESERTADKAAIVERDAKIVEASAENQLLKAVVTGKVEWVALMDQLEQHHRESITHWSQTESKLTAIITTLREAP